MRLLEEYLVIVVSSMSILQACVLGIQGSKEMFENLWDEFFRFNK